MRLFRADCGHYIAEGTAPAGIHVADEQPVYLCEECWQRAEAHVRPKLEKKDLNKTRPDTITIVEERTT